MTRTTKENVLLSNPSVKRGLRTTIYQNNYSTRTCFNCPLSRDSKHALLANQLTQSTYEALSTLRNKDARIVDPRSAGDSC